MARNGYTQVAEFHYVHHDKNGNKFNNLAEMGTQLIAAAKNAGLKITLVPIFYQKGGFGVEPNDGQRRFISPTIDKYLALYNASAEACKFYDGANIGIGIHSMRGVDPQDIATIASNGPSDVPFHIHIAEQLKEIEDSKTYLKKRPVEWLLDNVALNERYHLVHATHLTAQETKGIAQSKANVVICPTTEGNLGDGLFPLKSYQDQGGSWSIGTDSHVGLSPMEELRLLDYGQRLTTHKRNTFTSSNEGNSGHYALEMATIAGRKAMNNYNEEYFQIGASMDACVISAIHPLMATSSLENLASSFIYSGDSSMIEGTIVKGKWSVQKGLHFNINDISEKFKLTIRELCSR